MGKKIKIEVDKSFGDGSYSLSTFDGKFSGTRVAGGKPWGGSKSVHSFECDVDKLLAAIKADSYEGEVESE